MPVGNWNLDFLSHNSQRAYPLADDADGLDTTGTFQLPTDFIVELDLPVSAALDVDPARFFVRYVGTYATGFSVIVGYQPTVGDAVNVASALIPRQGFSQNSKYALGGIEPYDDTLGKVVIGRIENIDEQPPGMWEFSFDSGRLDPDAIRPIIRGVTALVCVNGTTRSARLTGDIELVAGTNMQIVPILAVGEDTRIVFNAISGEGTIDDCVCDGDAALGRPILSLSGVRPSANGDANILGSDCVDIEAIENGLRITNTCAKPCCGCAELELLTQELERLGSQSVTVQSFVDRLGEAVGTMETTVLGARLSDAPCDACG